MGAGRKTGGADVSDDLLLVNGLPLSDSGSKPAEVPVHRLVSFGMLEDDLVSISSVLAAEDDRSIRDCPNRAPRGGRIIDSIMGTIASQDRVST